MADPIFLIEKRGLYYKPNGRGYTGVRDRAGRYSLEQVAVEFPNRDSAQQDGITFVALEDAPEFSPACSWEFKIEHLTEQRDTLKTQGQRCRIRIGVLEETVRLLDPTNPLIAASAEARQMLGFVADQIEPKA